MRLLNIAPLKHHNRVIAVAMYTLCLWYVIYYVLETKGSQRNIFFFGDLHSQNVETKSIYFGYVGNSFNNI